ncbi:bacillithiol system redox-active protein YtxJ [soil metagenome]
MNWIPLENEEQLSALKEKSHNTPQVIFKHSTRCSISSMAKNRLDKSTPAQNAEFYYLDLIRYRNISNAIASDFSVYHESPQVLVIKNGKCIYDESHSGIDMLSIGMQLS